MISLLLNEFCINSSMGCFIGGGGGRGSDVENLGK